MRCLQGQISRGAIVCALLLTLGCSNSQPDTSRRLASASGTSGVGSQIVLTEKQLSVTGNTSPTNVAPPNTSIQFENIEKGSANSPASTSNKPTNFPLAPTNSVEVAAKEESKTPSAEANSPPAQTSPQGIATPPVAALATPAPATVAGKLEATPVVMAEKLAAPVVTKPRIAPEMMPAVRHVIKFNRPQIPSWPKAKPDQAAMVMLSAGDFVQVNHEGKQAVPVFRHKGSMVLVPTHSHGNRWVRDMFVQMTVLKCQKARAVVTGGNKPGAVSAGMGERQAVCE